MKDVNKNGSMNVVMRKGGLLQTHLSVSPLSLRVHRAVALGVLASWLGLWWVPLEGTAKLETLVLRWHGDTEARETLRAQVGLHARCYAIGAFETSPPVTQGVTRGSATVAVQHARVVSSSFCSRPATTIQAVGLIASSFKPRTGVRMCCRAIQCLPFLPLVPHLFFTLCHLKRCDSCTVFISFCAPSLKPLPALTIASGGGHC